MNIVKTINFHKNINIKTRILSNFPSAEIQIDLLFILLDYNFRASRSQKLNLFRLWRGAAENG